VPGQLAGPIWVDDAGFDLRFHVRRTTLPGPGTLGQLHELVGELMSGPLDRSRPLWELYLVRGLEGDHSALVTKTHPSLVDGVDTVDLAQVLLDAGDTSTGGTSAAWHPQPEPTSAELLAGAAWRAAQDPLAAVQGAAGLLRAATQVAGTAGATLVGRTTPPRPPAPQPPGARRASARASLCGPVSAGRRCALLSAPLADLRAVRRRHGHSLHDAVLAAVTGGLRRWLLGGGERLFAHAQLTALVPMAVVDEGDQPTALGCCVVPWLQRLPVGEPDPLARLHLLAYGTRAHRSTGRAVSADTLLATPGFAAPTLHAVGVRGAFEPSYDLLVSSAPGSPELVSAAGRPLAASYPLLPLVTEHRLSIGVTSYRDEVHLGLAADERLDLDRLVEGLRESLTELRGLGAAGPRPGIARRSRTVGGRR
jgi:diacylglycerol O-acyltransferase